MLFFGCGAGCGCSCQGEPKATTSANGKTSAVWLSERINLRRFNESTPPDLGLSHAAAARMHRVSVDVPRHAFRRNFGMLAKVSSEYVGADGSILLIV